MGGSRTSFPLGHGPGPRAAHCEPFYGFFYLPLGRICEATGGIWYAQDGKIEDAVAFAERAYAVAPKNAGSIGQLAGALWLSGDRDRSEQLLRQLGDGEAYGVPLGLVCYYMMLAEIDKAADWAEKAIEQRDPNFIPATCGPNRKFFRSAGRWPALARQMNLPETASGQ